MKKLANLIQKKNKALAEFITLSSAKEPYPNSAETISSDAIRSATIAGTLRNKLNSKALF